MRLAREDVEAKEEDKVAKSEEQAVLLPQHIVGPMQSSARTAGSGSGACVFTCYMMLLTVRSLTCSVLLAE